MLRSKLASSLSLLLTPLCLTLITTQVFAQSGSRGGSSAAAAYYQQLAQQQAIQQRQAQAAAIAARQAAAKKAAEQKDAAQQRKGIAVVELFTSQGCSSCPPADAALKQIDEVAEKRGLKVYALSFHVDYWDRLGWKDPYSQKDFSTRQSTYAAKKETNQIYTPQMIVNGTREFLGSDKKKAHENITQALRARPRASLALEASRLSTELERKLKLQYSIEGVVDDYAINFAVIQTPQATEVPRGENAGQSLSHVNVVRAFKVLIPEDSKGSTEIELPENLDLKLDTEVVAYLQHKESFSIVAANATKLR